MFEFTITKINKLGIADEKYGQRWWAEVTEDLKPVSFNVMQGEFKPGDKISCEESLNKRSTKGTDYLQLKKVQLVGSSTQTPPQSGQGVQTTQTETLAWETRVHEQLDSIERKIDQLLGIDEKLSAEPDMDEDEPSY